MIRGTHFSRNTQHHGDEDSEVEPEEDVVLPRTLVTDADLKKVIEANTPEWKGAPEWKGGSFTDGTPGTAPSLLTRPFTLRRRLGETEFGWVWHKFKQSSNEAIFG